MVDSIHDVLVKEQVVAWLPWAAQYFLYIGAAYASTLLFALCYFFPKLTSDYFKKTMAISMLIASILSPLALNADLHQPARAWHFYTNITPWSWMSWGSIFLPGYVLFNILAAWGYLRKDLIKLDDKNIFYRIVKKLALPNWNAPKIFIPVVLIAAVIFVFLVALYTGKEIFILKSREIWHNEYLPYVWFFSAFLLSIGFFTLLQTLIYGKLLQKDISFIRISVILSALVSGFLFYLWVQSSDLYAKSQGEFSLIINLIYILFLAAVLLSFIYKSNFVGLVFSGVLLLLGWYIRWLSMIMVQRIPKYDQGIYDYSLQLDANGLLGIVGIFGLWCFIAIVFSYIFDETTNTKISGVKNG